MITSRVFVTGSTGLLGNNTEATTPRPRGLRSGRILPALPFVVARISEFTVRSTRPPVLFSRATVRMLARQNDRSRFDHTKRQREPGIAYRAVSEALRDTVAWSRSHGRIPA